MNPKISKLLRIINKILLGWLQINHQNWKVRIFHFRRTNFVKPFTSFFHYYQLFFQFVFFYYHYFYICALWINLHDVSCGSRFSYFPISQDYEYLHLLPFFVEIRSNCWFLFSVVWSLLYLLIFWNCILYHYIIIFDYLP